MGFFQWRSRDKNKDGLVPASPNAHDENEPYVRMWSRGHLPDPGASIFSYDTLTLLPMYPINEYNLVKETIRTLNSQVFALPTVLTYELPQPNGQIFSQPLYDPNAG